MSILGKMIDPYAMWLLAQEEAKKEVGPSDMLLQFAPMIAIGLLFYLFLIKPQRKEQVQREAMLSALKKNDKVVTIGGMIGSVANISADGQEVTLKVDDNTRVRMIRSSIQRVMSADAEPDKSNEAK